MKKLITVIIITFSLIMLNNPIFSQSSVEAKTNAYLMVNNEILVFSIPELTYQVTIEYSRDGFNFEIYKVIYNYKTNKIYTLDGVKKGCYRIKYGNVITDIKCN